MVKRRGEDGSGDSEADHDEALDTWSLSQLFRIDLSQRRRGEDSTLALLPPFAMQEVARRHIMALRNARERRELIAAGGDGGEASGEATEADTASQSLSVSTRAMRMRRARVEEGKKKKAAAEAESAAARAAERTKWCRALWFALYYCDKIKVKACFEHMESIGRNQDGGAGEGEAEKTRRDAVRGERGLPRGRRAGARGREGRDEDRGHEDARRGGGHVLPHGEADLLDAQLARVRAQTAAGCCSPAPPRCRGEPPCHRLRCSPVFTESPESSEATACGELALYHLPLGEPPSLPPYPLPTYLIIGGPPMWVVLAFVQPEVKRSASCM